MSDTRTPASVRRHPANGAARFYVEVREPRGWVFISSRTTERAALDVLADVAVHPRQHAHHGQPVRVRDIIDGVIVGTRETIPVTGWPV